jgi:isocitrate dehydrogenase (NAD+)
MTTKKVITVIKGDGIGPSIVESALKVLDVFELGFEYEFAEAGLVAYENSGELIPKKTLDLIEKNKIALKGPLTTPVGEGFKSINVTLRKMFNLYANVRPAISFPNTKSRYESVNLITIRENTQGMYSGEGQIVSEDGERAEAMSVVTREGAEQILRFAYETAKKYNRKKVTVVHKANILKSTSGLFLKTAREIKGDYPDIETHEMIVDNACMQLVLNPYQFEVLVTTNLFGDIISDLCAGLVGGLGLAPGANIGENIAIFEAVHGSAPDIAGKNIANPSSVILASALMLEHLGFQDHAKTIRRSIKQILIEQKHTTVDVGGQSSTTDFTDELIRIIKTSK